MLLQALVAAVVIVGPVFLFATLVGIVKDGSPLNRDWWTS